MNSSSIEQLLRGRGAWLKKIHGDAGMALERAPISRLIADDYVAFETLRDGLISQELAMGGDPNGSGMPNGAGAGKLLQAFLKGSLVHPDPPSGYLIDTEAMRYLTGGWLEELAFLAAREAGAEEALFGQVIGWEFKGYSGENEIDLIMRRGAKLAFVSCKALRSELDMNDRKHRNRLMDAVHEADNLADHFGREGERVAVLVTTDLFDELKNVPRYQALMGKAAVLDVRVIALEELQWEKLVSAFREILETN